MLHSSLFQLTLGLCVLCSFLSQVAAQNQLGGNEHVFTSSPFLPNSESPFRINWRIRTEKLYANLPINASFRVKLPTVLYNTQGSVECGLYYGGTPIAIEPAYKVESVLGNMLVLKITETSPIAEANIVDTTPVDVTCVFYRPKIYIESPVFALYTYHHQIADSPTTLPITSSLDASSVFYPPFTNLAVSFTPRASEIFTNMTVTFSHNSYFVPVGTGLSIQGQTGIAYFSQPETGLACWVNNTQTVVMLETVSRVTLKMPFEVKGPATIVVTCSGLILRNTGRNQVLWVEYFYTKSPAPGHYFGGESVRIAQNIPNVLNTKVGFFEYVDVRQSGDVLTGTFSGTYPTGLGLRVYGGSQQIQLRFPTGFSLSHPPIIPTEVDVSSSCRLTLDGVRVSTSQYMISLTKADAATNVEETQSISPNYGFDIPASSPLILQCTYIQSSVLVRRPQYDMIMRVLDVKRLTNTLGVSPVVYYQEQNRIGDILNPSNVIGTNHATVVLAEAIVGTLTTLTLDIFPMHMENSPKIYSFKFAAPVHLQSSSVCIATVGSVTTPLTINNLNVLEYDEIEQLYYYTLTTTSEVSFYQNSIFKIVCSQVIVSSRMSTANQIGYFSASSAGITIVTRDRLSQPLITPGSFTYSRLFNGEIAMTDAYPRTIRTLSLMVQPSFSVPIGRAGFVVVFPSSMKLNVDGPSLPCTITGTGVETVVPVQMANTVSTYFLPYSYAVMLSATLSIECEVQLPAIFTALPLSVQFVDRVLSPAVSPIIVNTTLSVTPITTLFPINIQSTREMDDSSMCVRGCSMTFSNPRPNELTDLIITLNPSSQGLAMQLRPRSTYFANEAFTSIMSQCVITGPTTWSIGFSSSNSAITITRGNTEYKGDTTIRCPGVRLNGAIAQYIQHLKVTDNSGVSLIDSMTSPAVVPRPTRTTMEFSASAGQNSDLLITMYNAPSVKYTDKQLFVLPLPLNTGLQAISPGLSCVMTETVTNSDATPVTTTNLDLASIRHISDSKLELLQFPGSGFINTPGGVLETRCTGLVAPSDLTLSFDYIAISTYTTVSRRFTRYTTQYKLGAPSVVVPTGPIIGSFIASVVPTSVKAISDSQNVDIILSPLPMMLPAGSEIVIMLPPTWNVPSTEDAGSTDRCMLYTGDPQVQISGVTKARRLWDSRPMGYGKDSTQLRKIRFAQGTSVPSFTGITRLTCSLISIPSVASQSELASMRVLGPDGSQQVHANNLVLPLIFHQVDGHQLVEIVALTSFISRRTTTQLAVLSSNIEKAIARSVKLVVSRQTVESSGTVSVRLHVDLLGYTAQSAVAYLNERKSTILNALSGTQVIGISFGLNYIPSTCTDNRQNEQEIDVDCGGSGGCSQCALNSNCQSNSDCQSLLCSSGKCSEAVALVRNNAYTVTVTVGVILATITAVLLM